MARRAEAFLTGRGVPLNYSAADLEADEGTLEKIIAPSVSVVVADTSPLHYCHRSLQNQPDGSG